MYSLKSEYYDLPTKYDETIIRLLVQSPTRMYAYWEVSDDTVSFFAKQGVAYSESFPLLKITNLTKNYSYELPIDPFANNYYIETKDTDCKYQVTLARKYKDKVINVYSSNEVTIPRSTPCVYDDEAIFRNYICLADFNKIKIYSLKRGKQQSFEDVTFNIDNVSSSDMYIK